MCFKCGMCCLYDVLIGVILFVDLMLGEIYCCYYVIVDGYYKGKKVIGV